MKKIIFITIGIIFFITGFEIIRRKVGGFGGSYPFAKTWKVKKSMIEIENNLNNLHQNKPDIFFDKNKLNLQFDRTGYWKKIDFFYTDRNEIVQVLFREYDGTTSISLIGFINENSGKIKLMNKDFNWFQNRKEKEIFETRILRYL